MIYTLLCTTSVLGGFYCALVLIKYLYWVYVMKVPKDTVLKLIDEYGLFFKIG